MKNLHLLVPLLLGVASAPACTNPAPGSDASGSLDAGASDGATGWDHNVGGDVHFPPHDAGPGCSDVPTTGSCSDAGVLSWCEDNAVRSADCTALDLSCGEKPSLGGYWCLAGPNQSCRYWPCSDPLFCANSWICTGWPDAGAEDRSALDAGSEDHA